MKKTFILMVSILFLSGCATPYQKHAFRGGYTDTKIQEGIFKVTFRGNAFVGRDKVENLALLRCAEVTLENDYKYFIILDEKSDAKRGTYTTPVTAKTRGNIVDTTPVTTGGGVTVVGSSATYSGKTTYSGGQTYTFSKPRAYLTIQCFAEEPENIATVVYDADQVKTNLKQQYGIR